MPTSGDLKSGGSLFFYYSPHWISMDLLPHTPAPNGNDLGHALYEVLHELHTIKIWNHCLIMPEIILDSD